LMLAVMQNPSVPAINALIEAGADVNAKGPQGTTPLMCAVIKTVNPKIVELLIEKGADIKAVSAAGETIPDLAGKNPRIYGTPVYEMLLK